jgi:hypothetical protein
MIEAVIQRLRRFQGLGIVTQAHCIRAERYLERHPEIFSAPTRMTVSQAHSPGAAWMRMPPHQIRPGSRVVTSWTSHALPSGSLKEKNDP